MSALHVQVEIARFERVLRLEGRCASFPLAVLGPSGAGKTTLLECISGLVPPARGSVTWNERVLVDTARQVNLAPERRRVGYVMQDGVLFPHLSVRDNVLFPTRRRGGSGADVSAHRLLEELEIPHLAERRPHEISGGERTRVALARALACAPDLVLLDEPFVGLDPRTRERTQTLLMRTLEQHRLPAVLVTHERDEALRFAATTWVLWDGSIVQACAPEELVQRPVNVDVAAFVGVENLLRGHTLARADGLCRVRCGAFEIDVAADVPPGTPVYVCLRPEDVVLTPGASSSSARNHLPLRVTHVRAHGGARRVEGIVGTHGAELRLSALVTADAVRELGIEVGRCLVAQFKATAAHLLVRRDA